MTPCCWHAFADVKRSWLACRESRPHHPLDETSYASILLRLRRRIQPMPSSVIGMTMMPSMPLPQPQVPVVV